MIKACLFDLDGVIVDTAIFHYQAWKRLANELGFDLSESENEQLKGISRMESLAILLDLGNKQDAFTQKEKEAFAARKNEWYRELILKITPNDLLPGSVAYITQLRKEGYKIGLGSASKNAQTILQQLQITSLFHTVIDGTCITHSKPHPEVFLKGAEALNCKPQECVVFEDAQSGIEAALAGGMIAIGVGNKEQLHRAHRVIPDLAHASVELIKTIE
ncbi:MAG: beta-phosphoglucomutase [Bacteroidota bacterium]